MPEEIEIDIKEQIEVFEQESPWNRYLALTTAIIAVVAAIASLLSGSYSNASLLEKNNAVLLQSKASDQWNYYQAKGVKKNIADSFYTQFQTPSFKDQSGKYQKEQVDIQKQAEEFQREAEAGNHRSELLLEKHHKTAYAVTFFQIAIAFAALSALMKKRQFFYLSLILAALGFGFLLFGLI